MISVQHLRSKVRTVRPADRPDFRINRYLPEIWSLLDQTQPGAGGEIQLTDAIDELLKVQQVDAYRIVGHSHDCGNKLGYMKAQFEYGLHHPDIGAGLQEFLTKQKPRVEAVPTAGRPAAGGSPAEPPGVRAGCRLTMYC